MSYITDTDIERRLGTTAYIQLTDDAGTGAADLSVVAAAREGAVGEVNSFLARRFRVPIDLNNHPELALCAAEEALGRRGQSEVSLTIADASGTGWITVCDRPKPSRDVGQMRLF